MKRACLLLCVSLFGSLNVGCGQQSSNEGPQAAAPASQAASGSQAASVDARDGGSGGSVASAATPDSTIRPDLAPQDVVASFLDALRGGDERVAAELLTTKARTETAKHDLAVQPPGTPQATYRVGQVEYVTEDHQGAHVNSTWTEPTAGGSSESYQIVWVLRHETHGWRIAGMATEVVPGQAPLFLNFEDPADMLAKWRSADQELAGQQQQAAAQQARQPDSGATRR